MKDAPGLQVNLELVGGVHTGGPRPQVRKVTVAGRATIVAKAFSLSGNVEAVEFSLVRGRWHSMQKVFDGLWSEWEAEIEPEALRPGEYTLVVRAASGRWQAYDAVPVQVSERDAAPYCTAAAVPGPDSLFELFYPP